MKKKLLALLMSVFMLFGITTFSGCDIITETFDVMLENSELRAENSELKDRVDVLEIENATLKFEAAFPNRIIGEDSLVELNKVSISVGDKAGDAVTIKDTAKVVINGGYYDGGKTPFGGAGNTAIWINSADAKVTINAGEFFIDGLAVNAEGIKDTGHIDLIYCSAGLIEITGGIFKGANSDVWLLNCKDAAYKDGVAKIIVTGGTFFNWNPADCISEGEHTSFLAEGYEVQTTTDADGNILYTVIKSIEDETEPETPPAEEVSPEAF